MSELSWVMRVMFNAYVRRLSVETANYNTASKACCMLSIVCSINGDNSIIVRFENEAPFGTV